MALCVGRVWRIGHLLGYLRLLWLRPAVPVPLRRLGLLRLTVRRLTVLGLSVLRRAESGARRLLGCGHGSAVSLVGGVQARSMVRRLPYKTSHPSPVPR
ncbi:hypothetical protein ABZW18_31940 [Streptomyces sp. NPDC004647]|uniref:hypothetical protein n=1 Tax=Streptomyces sp. NPDC004647 TaxID=3154671 RepID=UPI0033B39C50